jgi:cytochrome c oxidase assembly protein subunit 15
MDPQPLVDFAPTLRLALLAGVIALLPLTAVWLRQRGSDTRGRLAALTAWAVFLTFDLVVFGAFTRLTDSGLGCPDWPGCYGAASPQGAHDAIHAAQAAMPNGPVSWSKAWIEMIHRYLAMTVGVLIVALALVSWRERRRLPFSLAWPLLTLVWVVVQGLFGKYTVTLKLYPAIVTLHLLGGLTLLGLLAAQQVAYRRRPVALPDGLRSAVAAVLALLAVQLALGGWVSSNYAVLACTGFPQCNGSWWPAVDFSGGFTVLRELGGVAAHGRPLTLDGLVAIHMAHRLFAVVLALALGSLAWRLRQAGEGAARRYGAALAGLLAAQLATGLSNVVLGWPLLAALAHTAGAAGLVVTLTRLLACSAAARQVPVPDGMPAAA